MAERTGALVDGALMGIGGLIVLDNVVVHWLLGPHRAIPGPAAICVEVGLVVLGAAMAAVGLRRERRGAGARAYPSSPAPRSQ